MPQNELFDFFLTTLFCLGDQFVAKAVRTSCRFLDGLCQLRRLHSNQRHCYAVGSEAAFAVRRTGCSPKRVGRKTLMRSSHALTHSPFAYRHLATQPKHHGSSLSAPQLCVKRRACERFLSVSMQNHWTVTSRQPIYPMG